MSASIPRRSFLTGAIAAASSLPALAGRFESPLYPPIDLSYFDLPITPAPSKIDFACASITWQGDDIQAIKDISEIGFRGIQLRSNILKEFGDRPQALRELLKQHRLEMVALSSGGVRIDAGTEADQIALHTRHARFVRDVGGHYLQLTDSALPKDRKPVADDYKKLGQIMTEISRRAVDAGVRVGYHNHMNSLGEAPEEIDRIMNEADPRYVKLELDIAHYYQGGGDPARAIRQYRDRILFLHIKDVEPLEPKPGGDAKYSYRFVELGRGKIDLPSVFAALREISFRGWAVVELDSVPDKSRTPKECNLTSKKYLEEKLGMKI
jgi:inosose dehydratase